MRVIKISESFYKGCSVKVSVVLLRMENFWNKMPTASVKLIQFILPKSQSEFVEINFTMMNLICQPLQWELNLNVNLYHGNRIKTSTFLMRVEFKCRLNYCLLKVHFQFFPPISICKSIERILRYSWRPCDVILDAVTSLIRCVTFVFFVYIFCVCFYVICR